LTLKELAKIAGVSISTVSRVVNKNDSNAASKEVRDKIWDLVHKTGYLPNVSAQSLKSSSKHGQQSFKKSIACVFARSEDGKSDPFFSQIYRAIEHECTKNSYNITGVFSAYDFKNASEVMELSKADGIIVMGRYSSSLLNFLKKNSKNIVYTGLNSINDSYDQIVCDGYKAAKAAVKHLSLLGHTQIGYVGEKAVEARYRGYYDAMQELKLHIDREYMIDTEQSIDGGYKSGLKFLTTISASGENMSSRPTAVFCANDITAVGFIKAMREKGISVPKDISVISIDNTELCQITTPMLTSIDIPKEELGKFTVKTLIDRIEGGHRLPVKIEIPFTLLSRESCASIKK